MALDRFRGRLPLVAFILLAVVCLLLFGFACACLSDQPVQAVERVLSAMAALPVVVVVWPVLVLSLLVATVLLRGDGSVRCRSSPAVTQRFLL